jgi:MFS family permease
MANKRDMLENKKFFPYFACLSAGLFSFYSIFQFALFNVISPNLISSFQLTPAQLSLFTSVFILTNTVWLVPGSLLLEKYPIRKVALVFMLLNVITNFSIAESHWLALSIVMRALQGMVSAMSLLTYVRLVPSWFPQAPATALGIIGSIASFGGVFANVVFVRWVISLGWRDALIIDAFLGLLFLIFMYFFLYEKSNTKIETFNNRKITFHDVKAVIRNIQNTIYGLYIGLMTLPIFLLASLWGVLYLTQAFSLPTGVAAHICALIFLGNIIGEPSLGAISDRFISRRIVMISGTALALLCILILLLTKNLTIAYLSLLFFGLGFFSSVQTIGYIAIKQVNPINEINLATGYACLLMNVIGIIAQSMSGIIIEFSRTDSRYEDMLVTIIISFSICLLLGMYMRNGKQYVDNR